MRKLEYFLTFALTVLMLSGCGENGGCDKVKPTRNVIFMLADGTSTSVLSLARWYRQSAEGYDKNLAIDPCLCGLCRVCHSNSAIAGSAGSMSTFMTGELTKYNNVCTMPEADPLTDMFPVDSTRAWQPVANIMDVARKEQGKHTGMVFTTYYSHATPACTAAHASSRKNYDEISAQMAAADMDVMFGGGSAYVTDKTRSILSMNGTDLIENDYDAFHNYDGNHVWALLAGESMNYDIDREDGEPSLAEMTSKAIDILSRDKKGFFLMVEGSCVDFAAHANDPVGVITDFLAFDDAVKVALDFAAKDGNTTVVITSDHGNSAITMGDRKYKNYSSKPVGDSFGSLPGYKATSYKIADMLSEAKPSEFRDIIEDWTGIRMTEEEESEIISCSGKTEEDYMMVGNTNNIQSAVAKLMTAHTHIAFISGNHTSEDVFYAVYNPHGQKPQGWITNQELNAYLCKVMGFRKPLSHYSGEYFVKAEELLKDYSWEICKDEWGDPAINVSLTDGRTAFIPTCTNMVRMQSDTVMTTIPSVYIRKNQQIYLPKEILDILK